MASNTSLYTDEDDEIPLFTKDYSYFLNKSIILYGSSGSGKSMIMRDILYILKDHIPNILVIAPTNHLNGSFDTYKLTYCDSCMFNRRTYIQSNEEQYTKTKMHTTTRE